MSNWAKEELVPRLIDFGVQVGAGIAVMAIWERATKGQEKEDPQEKESPTHRPKHMRDS